MSEGASFLASKWWDGVTAIATLATAGGVILAIMQLRFDAWLKAQEIWVHKDFVMARERLFRHCKQEGTTWTPKDTSAGMLACRRLDEFCRLAPYFSVNRALDVWDVPLGRLWAVLAPLVQAERDHVDWQRKWDSFELLGSEALNRLKSSEQGKLEGIAKHLEPKIRELHGVDDLPKGGSQVLAPASRLVRFLRLFQP